jgi:hypothetical protein
MLNESTFDDQIHVGVFKFRVKIFHGMYDRNIRLPCRPPVNSTFLLEKSTTNKKYFSLGINQHQPSKPNEQSNTN